MAASAQARRRPAQARRRPARRPTPRRGPSRIRWDRVGRVALTLVLVAVLYSYLNPMLDFVKTYTATSEAKAELRDLLRENRKLHDSIQSAKDPLVISQRSRGVGMVAEGERPVQVNGLAP